MHSDNTSPRAMKYVAALVFTTIALAIVLQDVIDLRHPMAMWDGWSLQHTLALLAVVAITLSAELTLDAYKEGRGGICAGFALVTVMGLLLIAYNSGGRQADAQAGKDLTAQSHNAKIDAAEKRLANAITAKSRVDADARAKSTERHCASNCRAVLLASQEAAAREVSEAREAVDALPARMALGSGKAAYWAETLAPILPAAFVERVAPRLEYTLWTLLAELGAIVSWCFALRHRPNVEPKAAIAAAEAAPTARVEAETEHSEPVPAEAPEQAPVAPPVAIRKPKAPKGGRRSKSKRLSHSEIISDLMLRAATGRAFESDAEAARTYGYSPSRFCELVKSWQADGSLPAGAAVSKRRAMEVA